MGTAQMKHRKYRLIDKAVRVIDSCTHPEQLTVAGIFFALCSKRSGIEIGTREFIDLSVLCKGLIERKRSELTEL